MFNRVPGGRTQMSDFTDNPDSSRRLSRRKKLAFSLIATVLFFVLLEGVLTVLGVGPAIDSRDPFFGFDGSSPLFVPDAGSDEPLRMVTSQNKLAWFNRQSFSRKKATGTQRVFCLGGSTTYGRPYDDTTSFPGWLRELLPRVAPQTKWEVINAGGISYASYRLARLADELTQYEPDVFIVYTGQNEFLEERSYGEIKRASPVRRAVLDALIRTRTAALAQRLLIDLPEPQDDRFYLPDDVDTVLDHTVGPTSYYRDLDQRGRILEHFEVNLARIVKIARGAGARVVLVTPASNRKDCSPFKSQHTDEVSGAKLREWTLLFDQARELDRDGKLEDALAAYEHATKLDPLFAELHWRTGRVLLKLRRFDQAQAAFARAVDEDVCPLRAVSEIPQIVRRTAGRLNVPLVDFERLVENKCRQQHGHAAPGEDFFFDHVHPTIETNGLLVQAIVEQMIDSHTLKAGFSPDKNRKLLAEVADLVESRVDSRQHAIALRNLAKVLNWAGKHLEAGSLAMRAVEQLPEDPECLVLSAAYLAGTFRVEQAIEHYRRALFHRPDLEMAHQLVGQLLVDRGELDGALVHFSELARLRKDDAHTWQMIGAIHTEQQRFEEALPNFETALVLRPGDANIHYNLANALSHLGRRKKAIEHYFRAVELNPDDADAHNNLGVMLMQAGHNGEAAQQFREVLRIRPDDAFAAASLRDAENPDR